MTAEVSESSYRSAEELLPLVYDELRQLAAHKLAHEAPGRTLNATALVHEAYLRLSTGSSQRWEGRRHFFGAAAEAMRRILVDQARRRLAQKRGGGLARLEGVEELVSHGFKEDVLALDEALQKLHSEDQVAAELVKLRYFTGLTLEEAAKLLEISPRTAGRLWAYARALLFREIYGD